MVESVKKEESKKSREIYDQLNFESDPEIRKNLIQGDKEVILWSSKLSKYNKYNWVQERNLKKGQTTFLNALTLQSLENLAGITKSLHQNSKQFVIHVQKEHDYRLRTDLLGEIESLMCKQNLPIYGIKNKDLREFTTTEKDKDKGVSRMPLKLARLVEEDVLEEQDNNDKDNGDLEIFENYTQNMEHRQEAYTQSRSNSTIDKGGEGRSFNKSDTSSTLFSRSILEAYTFDDFVIRKIIGKGTFGKVYLVENSKNGKQYAMKSIRKDIVIEHDSIENLRLEKLILLQHGVCLSKIIKNLLFNGLHSFCRGGELFKHLSEAKRFTEYRTKFYAAQVAMALGYLHQARIIYRDLKPENILLNSDGYILLADFGLAKINEDGDEPNSFCGTPEYLSPEMIVGSGHDHTLDWWALGILIYEMIIGIPPFYNKNKHQMYFLIQHAPIRWPEKDKHGIEVSEEAKDLISKLLEKDKKKRLGQNKDSEEILNHPFFKEIDTDLLIQKKIEAPYIPEIENENNLNLKVTESVLPEERIQKIESKKKEFENFGFENSDV